MISNDGMRVRWRVHRTGWPRERPRRHSSVGRLRVEVPSQLVLHMLGLIVWRVLLKILERVHSRKPLLNDAVCVGLQ